MLEFGQLKIEFRTFVESLLFEKSGFGDCRRRGAAGPTGAAGLGPLTVQCMQYHKLDLEYEKGAHEVRPSHFSFYPSRY